MDKVVMRNILVILAIIAIALLVSGCCNCKLGDITKPNNNPTIISKTITGTSQSLSGSWTNNKAYGKLTDPASAYNGGTRGIWVLFKNDGSFDEMILTSSSQYSGVMENKGDYEVAGNIIKETNILKSWYPDDSKSGQPAEYVDQPVGDDNFAFRFINQNTLVINNGVADITYYRL